MSRVAIRGIVACRSGRRPFVISVSRIEMRSERTEVMRYTLLLHYPELTAEELGPERRGSSGDPPGRRSLRSRRMAGRPASPVRAAEAGAVAERLARSSHGRLLAVLAAASGDIVLARGCARRCLRAGAAHLADRGRSREPAGSTPLSGHVQYVAGGWRTQNSLPSGSASTCQSQPPSSSGSFDS